jgi:hypothetical protein
MNISINRPFLYLEARFDFNAIQRSIFFIPKKNTNFWICNMYIFIIRNILFMYYLPIYIFQR